MKGQIFGPEKRFPVMEKYRTFIVVRVNTVRGGGVTKEHIKFIFCQGHPSIHS
jgi:hypothetical protein